MNAFPRSEAGRQGEGTAKAEHRAARSTRRRWKLSQAAADLAAALPEVNSLLRSDEIFLASLPRANLPPLGTEGGRAVVSSAWPAKLLDGMLILPMVAFTMQQVVSGQPGRQMLGRERRAKSSIQTE